jgi:RHS repeat-associated protein
VLLHVTVVSKESATGVSIFLFFREERYGIVTEYQTTAVKDMAYSLAGFNGERPDPICGHVHPGNGYRAYSPVQGRFTAPDSMSPFGAGGINPYAYCAGDPINRADPSGHVSLGESAGIALGLVGGFVLGVLTEGMALPVVASLLANMAGDAAIGALSELTTEAINGQRINGSQVRMAALVNAGFSLAGSALGKLLKLTGTRNRPFGGLMMSGGGIIHDASAAATPQLSGQFRRPQFFGIFRAPGGNARASVALSFIDNSEGAERLNIFGPVCRSTRGENISMGSGAWGGQNYTSVQVDPHEMANMIEAQLLSNPDIQTVRLAIPYAARAYSDAGSFQTNVEFYLRHKGINLTVTAPQTGFRVRGAVPTLLENMLTLTDQGGAVANELRQIPPGVFQIILNNMSADYSGIPGAFQIENFMNNGV